MKYHILCQQSTHFHSCPPQPNRCPRYPRGTTMSIRNALCAPCDKNPQKAIAYAWFTSIVMVMVAFICACASAAHSDGEGSASLGFAAVWTVREPRGPEMRRGGIGVCDMGSLVVSSDTVVQSSSGSCRCCCCLHKLKPFRSPLTVLLYLQIIRTGPTDPVQVSTAAVFRRCRLACTY